MNLVKKGKTGFGELGETLFTRRVWRATKLRGKFENLNVYIIATILTA